MAVKNVTNEVISKEWERRGEGGTLEKHRISQILCILHSHPKSLIRSFTISYCSYTSALQQLYNKT